MNRRWYVIGGIIVMLIALLALVILNRNKAKKPVPLKQVTVTSSMPGLLAQAKDLEAKGNILDAKAAYQKLINDFPNSNETGNWQKKIEDINIKLLFSPAITPNSTLYEIKPGDTLTKIAREFKTTPELIMKSNNLADDKILPGRKLKVWTAPFSILIDKSQNILMLKSNDEFFKTYLVATGVNNSSPWGLLRLSINYKTPHGIKQVRLSLPAAPRISWVPAG